MKINRLWKAVTLLLGLSSALPALSQTGPTRVGSQLTMTSQGELVLFYRGEGDALFFTQRQGIETPNESSWLRTQYLDGVIKGNPTSLFDGDGRLLVIARGTDDTMFFRKETAVNSREFSWWGQVPDHTIDGGDVPQFFGDPAVIRGKTGLLTIFSGAIDGAIWATTQTHSSGPFGGWATLGQPKAGYRLLSGVTAAISADGTQVIAVVNKQNRLFVKQQDQAGSWLDWNDLGGSFTSAAEQNVVSFGIENNGRLSIIANNSGGTVSSSTQTSINSKSWTLWTTLIGGAHGSGSRPAVARQANGTLAVFFWANYGSSLDWQYQTPSSTLKWSNWKTLTSPINNAPLAISDIRGNIHVLAQDGQGYWHETMQSSPDSEIWTGWDLGLIR